MIATGMITSRECLDQQTISDLLSGNLPESQFQDALQHLEDCSHCRHAAENSQTPQPLLTELDLDSKDAFELESQCVAIINSLVNQDSFPDIARAAMPRAIESLGATKYAVFSIREE